MKKNLKILARLSFLVVCISMADTGMAAAQQGKGQAKKEANQSGGEQETPPQKQKGKSGQAKENNRPDPVPADLDKADKSKREATRTKGVKNNPKEHPAKVDDPQDQKAEGNAYGRNKGNLSGREFGQQRAADARRTGEQRRENLGEAVEDGDTKVREGRAKITRARQVLEKDRQNKKLTDAQYKEKKNRIDRAERTIEVLEQKVAEGRQLDLKQ